MAGSGTSWPGTSLLVQAVAFRPDGKRLATIGEEGTIRVWDTGSGRQLRTISVSLEGESSRGAAELEPGRPAARQCHRRTAPSASGIPRPGERRPGSRRKPDPWPGARTGPGSPWAWSVTSGWRSAPGMPGPSGSREPVLRQRGWVHALCWSPDSRRLAAAWTVADGGSRRCRLTVCDATSGERVFQVDNHAVLDSIAFSPDGTRVATGGEEEVVRVFDAADGRQHAALFTGATQVNGLAFSPDGRRLYAAGWGMGGVKVFDPARDPRGRQASGLARADRGPDVRSRGPAGPRRSTGGTAAC